MRPKNLSNSLFNNSPVLILIFFVIVLIAGFWLYPFNLPSTGDPDALSYTAMCYSFIKAVRVFNEFPVWNPYFGGGIPWAGMVWNPSISPMALILIIFGVVIGIKVWLFSVYLLGAIGMYLMCHKCLLTSRAAGVLAGMLYIGSLWAAGRFNSGNYMEFVLLLLPLCIYLLYCVVQCKLIGILLPFVYLLALGAFGKYEVFLMMPFILFIAIAYRKSHGFSISQILVSFFITSIVFIGLGMPKFLPLLNTISANIADFQAIDPHGLQASKIIRSIMVATWIPFGHDTIGVGAGASLFTLIAFLLDWRKSLNLGVVLILAFLLTMGPRTPLWHIFDFMPIFDTMKNYPKYFNGFVLFALCGLFAVGIDAVLSLVRSDHTARIIDRWQWLTLLLIFFSVVLPPSLTSYKEYKNGFWLDPYRTQKGSFFHVAEKRWIGSRDKYRLPNMKNRDTIMYYNLMKNRGTITWYGNFRFPEYPEPKYIVNRAGEFEINAAYKGEIFCPNLNNKLCDITDHKFTFNTISFKTGDNFSSGRAVFNFNYHPGWSSNDARVVNANGLLAVDLNDKTIALKKIHLRFIDKRFNAGVVIFVITLIVWLLGYFVYYKRTLKTPQIFN